MIDLTDCRAIGTIIKAHGIRGEVMLRLDQTAVEDIKKLEPVFLEIEGLPVPFFVSDWYEKDPHCIILSFEDYDSNEAVRELINARVFIPLKNVRKTGLSSDEYASMVGFKVVDAVLGELGYLAEVVHNGYNPLFRIVHGAKEILIPVQPAFISKIDTSKKIIHVKTPDGLIDLN
jgi:16S rRNA processing protein RimM